MSAPAMCLNLSAAASSVLCEGHLGYTSKGFLVSCENNGFCAFIVVDILESIVQLDKQGGRQGIEGSWTIKGD